jgi:hypothetical protein
MLLQATWQTRLWGRHPRGWNAAALVLTRSRMNSTSDDERRRIGRGGGAGGGGSVCSNVSGVIIFMLCCRDYCFRLELLYGRITGRLKRGREFIRKEGLTYSGECMRGYWLEGTRRSEAELRCGGQGQVK